jgi:SulP family sulfate permease
MFFGSAGALERHFEYMEGRVEETTRVLVLRMKRLRNPDAVAISLLESFLERMHRRGVHVLMCGVRAHLHESLARTGVAGRLGEQIFLEQPVRQTSTLLAIRHAYALLDELCPSCPRRDKAVRDKGFYFAV